MPRGAAQRLEERQLGGVGGAIGVADGQGAVVRGLPGFVVGEHGGQVRRRDLPRLHLRGELAHVRGADLGDDGVNGALFGTARGTIGAGGPTGSSDTSCKRVDLVARRRDMAVLNVMR